jgi:hypothetical protein
MPEADRAKDPGRAIRLQARPLHYGPDLDAKTDLRKDVGVRPEGLRGFYGSREGLRPRPSRAPLAGTTRVQGGW